MKHASLALLAALALLTACETTEGLGRDTQKLGNDITGSAEKHDLDNDPNN
jgi:predicted small secreted protein